METSLLLIVFTTLVAFAFISKKIRARKPEKKLPPGPKPWPIIGNLHQLSTLPHISIHKFAQKYGEIMMLKYGFKTVVVASSSKMAEEFLKTHDSVFAARPRLAAGKWTGYNYQDMLWSHGPHWRMGRKIYLTELFNPKRLDSFEHIRVDERRKLLSGLYAQRGNPLVLKDHVKRYTLSSITRVVFSNEYLTNLENNNSIFTFRKFHEMLDEWTVLNGVVNIGDWIPFLSFFDLQGYVKRMKILNEKFEIFYNSVIDDHKSRMEAADKDFVAKDMLDVLLSLTREDTDPEIKLTIEAVKALVHDLMPGGTDTSAISIEWAIYELFRHPQIMEKAREEIERVIGRERWVEEDDYPDLPYIDAIIKETFRLHPITTLLPPHYALEDCNVAGYDIAKGAIVLINLWSIGRNPDYWDEPLEFKPERFLQSREISMIGQDFALLPFGAGRRRCPAYSLGLKLVRTTLSNLLHGFNWKFPEGFKPEDICMVERYGVATCPEVPVTVIPEPRLPGHLYQ